MVSPNTPLKHQVDIPQSGCDELNCYRTQDESHHSCYYHAPCHAEHAMDAFRETEEKPADQKDENDRDQDS